MLSTLNDNTVLKCPVVQVSMQSYCGFGGFGGVSRYRRGWKRWGQSVKGRCSCIVHVAFTMVTTIDHAIKWGDLELLVVWFGSGYSEGISLPVR